MNPVHRLRWLATVAQADLRPVANRVAMVAAHHARDGRLMHGTSAMAKDTGLSFNGAAAGLDLLVDAGFLTVEQKARQHTPAIYRLSMSRVPRERESDALQGPTPVGVSGDPGSHETRPRVPRNPSQGPTPVGPHGVQGEQGEDDLARLRHSGAHLTRAGDSIAGEWSELVTIHGLDVVMGAMAKLPPKDKWPSRVRAALDLHAELPGLTERRASPDEIREAMGLPAGAPADG